MNQGVPLPPSVEGVVTEFIRLAERRCEQPLDGLYLVGSIALEDFRPGRSDIDFVAILEGGPTAETCQALSVIHTALAEAGGPHFDGFYLPAAALREVPRDYAVAPFSLDGVFRTGETCREINPVVWRCLARSGKAVLGPDPVDLGIADDQAVRRYQVDNLRSYWPGWIDRCETQLSAKAVGQDCNAEALVHGVLGVGRIACALETDRVVSKGEAGRHALATRSDRWHPVVQLALSAHAGDVARVSVEAIRDGLAYMRVVIAEAPVN